MGAGSDQMDEAIDNLKKKSYQCFYFFITQLLFFHVSSFLLVWILYNALAAIIVNIVLGIFLVLFLRNC